MNWRWHFVAELLANDNPKLGAEIGVKEGRFISHLLRTFPDLTMYAVDPWVTQPNGNETYMQWDFNSIYHQYKKAIAPMADRVIELKTYSHLAAINVPDQSIDFVFIDAQHDYASVKQDIAAWASKVKPGGLICGHDYDDKFPGVVQAVNEVYQPTIGRNAVWYVRA